MQETPDQDFVMSDTFSEYISEDMEAMDDDGPFLLWFSIWKLSFYDVMFLMSDDKNQSIFQEYYARKSSIGSYRNF